MTTSDINPYQPSPPLPASSAEYAETTGAMELDFSLGLDDFAAWGLFAASSPTRLRQVLRRRQVMICVVMGLAGFAVFGLLGFPSPRQSPLAYGWLAFLVTFLLLIPWIQRRSVARSIQQQVRSAKVDRLLGPRRLRIDADGVRQWGENFESFFRWPVFELIGEDDARLYLLLGASQAIIVPKGAFRDAAHCQAFLNTARKYLAHALPR